MSSGREQTESVAAMAGAQAALNSAGEVGAGTDAGRGDGWAVGDGVDRQQDGGGAGYGERGVCADRGEDDDWGGVCGGGADYLRRGGEVPDRDKGEISSTLLSPMRSRQTVKPGWVKRSRGRTRARRRGGREGGGSGRRWR